MPYVILKKRDGTVYEGQLGDTIKTMVDGRNLRKGWDVRLESGVWIEVWADELSHYGRKPPA